MADSRSAWDRPRAPWNFRSLERGLRWLRSLTWVARPLPIDPVDGAAHVYVNPVTGDDGNDGLTAAEPFRTWAAGTRRVNEWLLLGIAADIVLETAGFTSMEAAVAWRLPVAPVRRVIVRGPTEGTVLASGTLTAASVNSVTDSGAALGATHQHARRILRVWDPADEDGTVQYKTIRSHSATVIDPVGPFMVAPQIGWLYRIIRPSARLVSTDRAPPALSVSLPWTGGAGNVLPGSGPGFILAFVEIDKNSADDDGGLAIAGGDYAFLGTIVETNTFTGAALTGFAQSGHVTFETPDLVFGMGAFDFGTFWDCGFGMLANPSGGGVGLRMDSGNWSGPFVAGDAPGCDFPFFAFARAFAIFRGGALHRGRPIFAENSVVDLNGGGFGSAIPFFVRNSGSHGLEYRGDSGGFVGPVAFEAIAGDAIHVGVAKRGAQIQVDGPITEVGAGVTGFCIDAQDSAKVAVAAGVVGFAGGAGEIRADAATGTFAGLTVGSPVVGANTAARVWRQ